MERLFLTGMGRSGTSLLDMLIGESPEIDMLSQPFPLIFIEAKPRYLKTIGRGDYYVLNDDRVVRTYWTYHFRRYLPTMAMTLRQIEDVFARMRSYSGQRTRLDFVAAAVKDGAPKNFGAVVDGCLHYFELDRASCFVGIKEIMCEEFIPYLLANGHNCIVVLRDPRNVLASANYPRSEKHLGDSKPALFLLRTWRKSVEFAWSLRDNPDFMFLRYDDLVTDTTVSLQRILKFLALGYKRALQDDVRDRSVKACKANSSRTFGGAVISAAPVGSYRRALDQREIDYTEVVCGYEMGWFMYDRPPPTEPAEIIRSFRGDLIVDAVGLPGDFNHRPELVALELARLGGSNGHYS